MAELVVDLCDRPLGGAEGNRQLCGGGKANCEILLVRVNAARRNWVELLHS